MAGNHKQGLCIESDDYDEGRFLFLWRFRSQVVEVEAFNFSTLLLSMHQNCLKQKHVPNGIDREK